MTVIPGLLLALACQSGGSQDAGPDGSRGSQRPRLDLSDAPEWLTRGCRSHWKTEAEQRAVLCGVGSAPPSRDRVAARETAIARARAAIARSIEVTIESLVRLEDSGAGNGDGELRTIAHQLSTASLPGSETVAVWRSGTGEVHALVALSVARVQRSVRVARAIPRAARESLARRAADAFAAMDEALAEE